jgi:predicted alpha/beta-hydrolase family hydrolase
VGERSVTSGILTLPEDSARATGLIVAHGAGNDMEAPLLVAFSEGLAFAGYPVLRFNFPYSQAGRKAPDKYETLAETWQSAEAFLLENIRGLRSWVAAGKSMGGRVASQMAADGLLGANGLVFLGYPLHPAGGKDKLRDAHLYRVAMPMLFFAGTRDPLCDLGILRTVLERVKAPWDLDIVDGGDHSFHVPKSAGVSEEHIFSRIVGKTARWLEEKGT